MTLLFDEFDEFFSISTISFILAKGVINFSLREREKEDDSLYMSLMTMWAFGSTKTLVDINS